MSFGASVLPALVLFWAAIPAAVCGADSAPPRSARKLTIKQVMKDAIKGDHALVKKACKGTASPDELARLVDYCRALCAGSPPRGEADSWQEKTAALLAAAERISKEPGNKEASFELEKAVECRRCHNAHKPAKN